MTGPLAGVRVLDFSRVLAGPFCTMTLADWGADVVKVEHPAHGDETRMWGPPWAADGASAYFWSVNRGKRSLALDLKMAEGRATALALAAQAHIVVENFKPGDLARLGLGYDVLRAQRRGLVLLSISGYGQDGPWQARPGYDYVIQAMSGLMSITGAPDGPPTKVGVAVTDVVAGLYAASAVVTALRHAEISGEGQHIDVSLHDTALAALVNVAANTLVSGLPAPRYGDAHPNIVPYQTFRAADGLLVLAVGNDRQFAALCGVVGQPALAADARYATNPARVQHRAALVGVLAAAFAAQPVAHWVGALLKAGVPAGPVQDVAQALASEQAQARGLVAQVPTAHGDVPLVGPAVRLTGTRAPSAPPALGADGDAVLRDWLGRERGV